MIPNLDAALTLVEANPDVAAHGREVARIAARIGNALGFGEKARATLGLAAGLHDIGKLSIPCETLNKPGPLDPDEWAQVRLHPVLGEHVVIGAGLGEVAPWVRCHHERPDGRGYPQGLTGDAIPLQSRIIAVADAYDAMVSDRPYSAAISDAEARGELVRGSGTQFDARVVAAFLGLRFSLRPQPQAAAARSLHAVA